MAEKNPNFYDAANVKIDKVIYYPDEDRNAVTKRFRAGEIDFQDEFASEQIDFLKRELPNETHDLALSRHLLLRRSTSSGSRSTTRRCAAPSRSRSTATPSPARC